MSRTAALAPVAVLAAALAALVLAPSLPANPTPAPEPGLVLWLGRTVRSALVGPDILAAVQRDDRTEVAAILAAHPELASKPDDRRELPLNLAPSIAMAELLIARGADVNAAPKGVSPALHVFSATSRADMVTFLIARGANVHFFTHHRDQGTALHQAARFDQVEVARILVGAGAKLDTRVGTFRSATPLMKACGHGSARVVEYLLPLDTVTSRSDCLNIAVEHGGTRGIRTGDENVVRLLLAAGADPNLPPDQRDLGDDLPLHRTARLLDPSMVRLLLAHGARVDERNRHGLTPFQAMESEDFFKGYHKELYQETRQALLDAGARP